jgi:hypothetical protein
MRSVLTQSLVWGAFFVSGLIVSTKPSAAANCVLYARAETGVALFGDAGGWWDQANGRYQRGHVPAVGAVLVFKRTQRIPSGHVAVVAKVVSANEVLVDYANWYRGRVNRGMSVIDTSPGHDWTSVAVIDPPSETHGRDYPTYGFVYPGAGPREIVEARDNGRQTANVVDDWESLDLRAQPAVLHVAFTPEGRQLGIHPATQTPRNQHARKRQDASFTKHRRPTRTATGSRTPKPAHPSNGFHLIAAPANAPDARNTLTRSPTLPIKTTETEHNRA